MIARPLAYFALAGAVAGCGSGPSSSNTDMLAAPMCAAMAMDLPSYTGDAAGAFMAALPIVQGFQADAALQEIDGSSIGVKGRSVSGMNGGQWVVDFYSPSTKQIYRGVFSGDHSHVGCQPDLKARLTQTFPGPTQNSVDVVSKAWTALGVKPDPQKVRVSVTYGLVSQGSNAPLPMAWKVDAGGGYIVLIKDADLSAVECYAPGSVPCN